MTKNEAKELFIGYDLQPWYEAKLERQEPFNYGIWSAYTITSKCLDLFYAEVKDRTKKEWEDEVNNV